MPKVRVYKKGELPASYGYAQSERIGDLILSPVSPYYIQRDRNRGARKKRGTHGYDPASNKNMQGIFYARGPQIANKGEIAAFENIHIYPFVMDILGLEIRTSIDGDRRVLAPYRR